MKKFVNFGIIIVAVMMETCTTRTITTSASKAAEPSCVAEFDKCVTNRDCCPNLECVTGDWQYTTDSTCLSHRSQTIESDIQGMTLEEKTSLLLRFYQTRLVEEGTEHKSPNDVGKIAYKYRHDFPKLVAKLERKYGQGSFPDIRTFRETFLLLEDSSQTDL
ncbi:hypothetical protein IV203_034504 [Nitzschia inconspicua]|uniref:Uncharacterized protein n=1 Tax=Nitzschia inconspicua TaxID=303405 RepID=A0A9K3LE96_9STRA|nr:hypothetical protein IV203_002699 [Nitzschia inconspicua]KAG7339507.1 hypothetical protein IV203_002560 [Nitzschia inconspicua]KAG7359406.1 hypothetical protein IV203_034504 [Nitzschia inconspicua]